MSSSRLPFGISACLIVRDEQAMIGRCLASLSDLDQVVVADTGSKDRTAAIARGLGADVVCLGIREPFHFGDARQAALSRASYLWTLSIDADEVLLPGASQALARAAADFKTHAWEVGFLQRSRHDDPAPVLMPLKRFFRSDLHRWRFRVHEQAVPVAAARMGRLDRTVLEHLPAGDREKRKGQNFELLKIAVDESPDYPRLRFYLADEYRTRGDLARAIEEIGRYLESGVDEGALWLSEARLFLGMMLGKTGRKDDAVRALEAAWKACPDRREPLVHAAELELAAGRPGLALWYLERALAIPEDRRPDFHLNWPSAWGRMPYEALSGILRAAEAADPGFWAKLPKEEAARLRDLGSRALAMEKP